MPTPRSASTPTPYKTYPTSISTGTITEISSDGRFGFITPDCGGIEVFFHVSNCVDHYAPHPYDRVSYLTRLSDFPGRRSCFTAINLSVYSPWLTGER